jgi:hypothetical protein
MNKSLIQNVKIQASSVVIGGRPRVAHRVRADELVASGLSKADVVQARQPHKKHDVATTATRKQQQ